MADFFDDQNNSAEDEDIITLFNETTNAEEDYYHLATLDVDKRWFIVMKPVEKLEDFGDDEVLIYEIVTNAQGEDEFAPIEDDALLQRVFDEFAKELDAYENECCGCGCGSDSEECGCGGCHCHEE
jgi:hypothetical protein